MLVAAPPMPVHEVQVRVATAADARRLARLHLDTADTPVHGRMTVVVRSRRDGRRLRRAGFTARRPVRGRATAAPAALPSGRATYRTLDDYEHDMDALVAAHPGLVRKITLPGTSVLGRPMHGVEIATGVERTDDGRPTVLHAGLHHAREWPSGEVVMEYALELAAHADDDPRIGRIVDGERTVVIPVMNPDGLVVSQAAVGGDPYKRRNCSGGIAGGCGAGVDLNRDYGAFWGGPGASPLVSDETYRGPSPFSEPEVRALRAFEDTRQLTIVDMTHTFGGQVLHQPGFHATDEPGLPAGATIPYQDRMAALGASMAAATGYTSAPAYELYDATGAAEDLTYFAQGAFGYTVEIAGSDFHSAFADGVAAQWPGMRELFLRVGEAALDPANHATIAGTAPPGSTLRLTKDVALSTSYVDGGPAQPFTEHLESTLTVPDDGRYRWAVGPSTPPLVLLAGGTQAWTLTCGTETRAVTVALGATATENLACGASRLAIRGVRRHGHRLVVRLGIAGGPLTHLRLRIAGHTSTRSRAHAKVSIRAPRRPGRYRLRVTARAPDGHTVAAQRRVRIRR